MTVDKSKFRQKRLSTIVRIVLFYLCSLLVLMFTSRLTKGLSPNVSDILSVSLASVLTFLLVYLFTRWKKLRLIDVGVIPGKATIRRFAGGYVIGLSMAAIQALTVLAFGYLVDEKVIQTLATNPVVTLVVDERLKTDFKLTKQRQQKKIFNCLLLLKPHR